MTVTPLFNRAELESAFALVTPIDNAIRLAELWWLRFASPADVDASQNYLVDKRGYSVPGATDDSPRGDGLDTDDSRERAYFSSLSVEEWEDHLLSFSGFHLDLVSLVSEAAFERVRQFRSQTPEYANRVRHFTWRTVAAMRR